MPGGMTAPKGSVPPSHRSLYEKEMMKMKKAKLFWSLPLALLLSFGIPLTAFAAGGELLVFKPHSQPLKYNLMVKTHSELETNSRSFGTERGVTVEHEDVLALSQRVEKIDGGLLDIALTVDEINLIPHGPSIGAQYKREEIIGNSRHTTVSLLGEVQEVKGFPHFASGNYYFGGHDSAPLDFYRVMLMIYPQFPLRLLKAGDSWEVKDKITVEAADIVGAVAAIEHNLDVKLNRRIKYTLLGYTERMGYRTAHIAFEARYGFDVSMISTYNGYYSDGSGEDTGEFYFAPEEGIVVEASIKSNPVENKSVDGMTVFVWLDGKTRIFLDLHDRTTVPLKWRTDKTISFELAGN